MILAMDIAFAIAMVAFIYLRPAEVWKT